MKRCRLRLVLLFTFSWLAASGQNNADTLSCTSLCCGFDPTPAGIMISHVHEKGKWMLSYRYMNMAMGNMQVGKTEVENAYVFQKYLMTAKHMNMGMHMLMGMTGLSDRLTLMAMLQYQTASMRGMEMRPNSQHQHPGTAPENIMDSRMHTSGLGDTKLYMLFGLLTTASHQLVLYGGAGLPTGSINHRGGANSMYYNSRLPYSMQTGSGTFDLMPGVSYLYRTGNFTIGTQLGGVLRTGNNRNGYRPGNEWNGSTWLAWQWARNFSASVRSEFVTAAPIHGADAGLNPTDEPSADASNYGGDKIHIYPGAVYRFKAGLPQRISVEYGVPVYQNLYGPQMKSRNAVNINWEVSF